MLIGLCGFRRAGKDAVARGLVEVFGFERFAFADAIRREVEELDGIAPVVDARKDVVGDGGGSYRDALLARGAQRRAENPDYWIEAIERAICAPPAPANVVVTDCRLPKELDWIRENDGFLAWVHRDGLASNGHDTERDWQAACDVVLHNDWRNPVELATELMHSIRSLGRAAA